MTERIALGKTTLAHHRNQTQCDEQFAALVQRHSPFVFSVAFALLRNAQDAEDVAQEVFLKLYRTGAWRQMKEERAYLARVTWRTAANRKSNKKSEPLVEDSASPQQNPEQVAVSANRSAIVHTLIDALPDEFRMPLALSAVQELTSPEIAQILGIPEGTVRTRLMKAREILKQKLARYE